MQKKEAQGDDDSLPDEVTSNLLGLTKEACEQLTVFKIKKVRSLIDEAIEANNKALGDHEKVSYIHQKKGGLKGARALHIFGRTIKVCVDGSWQLILTTRWSVETM